MTELLALDATAQVAALRSRDVSARELLDLCVRRADEADPPINAVVSRDLPRAYREADKTDARRVRGDVLGPLSGLPMTVKEHFDIEGFPSSYGGDARYLKRTVMDAAVIAKLRSAGAVIWGRTNQSLYGSDVQAWNKMFGTTNNPWDVSRTCGGSSGGSAAALALGITAAELGSDIGGSVRIPASFCGVCAHKPSFGLISQQGFAPAFEPILTDIDMAVIGPMARSVRDLRLLLSVTAECPIAAEQPPTNLHDLRIAAWCDDPNFALDPEIRTPLENLISHLDARGARITRIVSPVASLLMLETYMTLICAFMSEALPWSVSVASEALGLPARACLRAGAGPLSWARAVFGFTLRYREWRAIEETRARLRGEIAHFFEQYDVLIAPVAPVAAFPHDHRPMPFRRLTQSDGRRIRYLEMVSWVCLANLLGLPATVIPIGTTVRGLPVGIQIIAANGGDCRTLEVAEAIMAETGDFRWPPNVFPA